MNTYPAQEPQETALKDFTLGGGVSNVAERVPLYSYYALAVLTAACILNYVDRQIVSILAQSIKVDLVISDAQLGFLLGTAFAVFYAVLGIAMGRIADVMSRSRLMAGGLALWSAMTALGGAATNFTGLSATRIGVGVGEASANPLFAFAALRLFPAATPRCGVRNLSRRRLYRQCPRADPRRADRSALERPLPCGAHHRRVLPRRMEGNAAHRRLTRAATGIARC